MTKYLKYFDNNEQRSAYELSENYVTPYVSAIKGTNGGGVEPRYNVSSNVLPNVPSNALCILTLKDNSNVHITGKGEITINDVASYNDTIGIKSAILTDRCTAIGEGAFNGCLSLQHISLPSSLRIIENGAFNGCGLVELIIPEGTQILGDGAISDCSDLETLVLPGSLSSIGYLGFLDGCPKLKTIKLYGTLSRINGGFDIFLENNQDGLTLYVDQSLVETYKQHRDGKALHYNILPIE